MPSLQVVLTTVIALVSICSVKFNLNRSFNRNHRVQNAAAKYFWCPSYYSFPFRSAIKTWNAL